MSNNLPLIVGELVEAATANTWSRGYLRKSSSKTVNGTVTSTDLFNGDFVNALPGGALGTNKILRLSAWGDWKQNSGAPRDIPSFVLAYGPTTLATSVLATGNTGGAAAAADTTRYGWKIGCTIQNLGATNSQWATFAGVITYTFNNSGFSPFLTGEGLVEGDIAGRGTYDGGVASAIDSTVGWDLKLFVTNANNNANYETKLLGALVEII